MSNSRRNFFRSAALIGTGLFGWAESLRAQMSSVTSGGEAQKKKRGSTNRIGPPAQMITPNVRDLPFEMDGDVKVFRLVAEPVKRTIVPWKTLDDSGATGRPRSNHF
jgi:manganese oxidase